MKKVTFTCVRPSSFVFEYNGSLVNVQFGQPFSCVVRDNTPNPILPRIAEDVVRVNVMPMSTKKQTAEEITEPLTVPKHDPSVLLVPSSDGVSAEEKVIDTDVENTSEGASVEASTKKRRKKSR